MEESYQEVVQVLRRHASFLVASHAHPDGDAIGSTLAIGLALRSLGKEILMYNQDPVPASLDFLPEASAIVNTIPSSCRFDATIMVDCAQTDRAGRDFPSRERRGQLVCIDHHIMRCTEADVICQDEVASSTGEVVYNILKRLGISVDADLATLILTTIIVDTNFFRYSNTSAHALSVASELVGLGASTWRVAKNMEERNPPAELALLSECLKTIDYHAGGAIAVMVLTQQMFRAADATVEMAEEFINFPRSVRGVEVAILIREQERGKYKISFRSKERVNVASLAAQFDGGGHEHAAGCTIYGRLGEVKQKVVTAAQEVL